MAEAGCECSVWPPKLELAEVIFWRFWFLARVDTSPPPKENSFKIHRKRKEAHAPYMAWYSHLR